MSNPEEINKISPHPTSKDPKGCPDDHKKDDDIEKNTAPPLQQDPEGRQGIAQDNHLVDDDDVKKREVILHQDPKGCPDIEPNQEKDDVEKNIIEVLQQDPKGCPDIEPNQEKDDVEKNIEVLQQDPKGCQDITHEDDVVETVLILDEHCSSQGEKSSLGEVIPEDDSDVDTEKVQPNHLKDDDVEETEVPHEDVVDEPVVFEKVCCNSEGEKSKEVVPEDDDDGFRTPTCLESRIPVLTECPGAPRKPIINPPTIKRKASPSSRRRFRVRIDFR